jgi:hypothetical protein
MVPTTWLLMAALVGPGIENLAPGVASDTAAQGQIESDFGSLREAREAVAALLRASKLAGEHATADAVVPLVAMYRRMSRSQMLPAAERRVLQGRLRARLSDRLGALRRREQRRGTAHSGGTAADMQSLITLIETTIAPDTWEPSGSGTLSGGMLSGGGALSGGIAGGASELLDLIQTTIEPETWEINGGNGSIVYFPNR